MKTIYCISGLGATAKAFSKLNIEGCKLHVIEWLIPLPKETIEEYAARMAAEINEENPVLLGLSFGGMMCIEIARQIKTELIIIISSIKSKNEMPLWMRISGKLKLNRLFPMRSFKLIEPIEDYNLGVSSKEEKEMVHYYRKNIDPVYSNWAINVILNWKNKTAPKNIYHIHGDIDRIFSIKKIKPDYTIHNGGHLMILNKSDEVNTCISSILTANMK